MHPARPCDQDRKAILNIYDHSGTTLSSAHCTEDNVPKKKSAATTSKEEDVEPKGRDPIAALYAAFYG